MPKYSFTVTYMTEREEWVEYHKTDVIASDWPSVAKASGIPECRITGIIRNPFKVIAPPEQIVEFSEYG